MGLLIASIMINIGQSISVRSLRAEKERYKANQTALLSEVEHYKTESGKNAATVQKLTLTHDELKKNYDEVCNTVEELKIKVKRLQSITNTSTQTKVEVRTIVKDSIVYRDGVINNLLTFQWADAWVSIDGKIEQNSVALDFCSTDTLVQMVHKVPHKFLFFKWGCKAIKQDIVSKNPHTNITYTEYIELK